MLFLKRRSDVVDQPREKILKEELAACLSQAEAIESANQKVQGGRLLLDTARRNSVDSTQLRQSNATLIMDCKLRYQLATILIVGHGNEAMANLLDR